MDSLPIVRARPGSFPRDQRLPALDYDGDECLPLSLFLRLSSPVMMYRTYIVWERSGIQYYEIAVVYLIAMICVSFCLPGF